MKKQTLLLIINAALITLLSVVFLLVYQNVIPKTETDKLFGTVVVLGEESVVTNIPAFGNYTIVHTEAEAFNKQGDKIGTVYLVKSVYTYFNINDPGIIELLVGIDLNNKVTVQIVNLKQTPTYNAGIQQYVQDYFQGFATDQVILIPPMNLEEIGAGATASLSTAKVKELVAIAIQHHINTSASLSEVNQA
jgi:hypothetical protein